MKIKIKEQPKIDKAPYDLSDTVPMEDQSLFFEAAIDALEKVLAEPNLYYSEISEEQVLVRRRLDGKILYQSRDPEDIEAFKKLS